MLKTLVKLSARSAKTPFDTFGTALVEHIALVGRPNESRSALKAGSQYAQ